MRHFRPILLLTLLLSGCLRRPIVNPDIITRGAPGNTAAAPSALPAAGLNSASELIFLESEPITLPAGTELSVKMMEAIDASTVKSGDSFQASLVRPLTAGAAVAAPAGSLLVGQISDLKTSRGGGADELSLALFEILINHRWFPLHTDLLTIRAEETGKETLESPAHRPPANGTAVPEARTLHLSGSAVALPAGQPVVFYLTQPVTLDISGTAPQSAPDK